MSAEKDHSRSSHEEGHSKGSSFGAYVNIVCATAGVGILGLAQCLAVGGWLSVIFILLAGLASVYNGRLLIECIYKEDGTKLSTFTDVGDRAFGKVGRYLAKFSSYSLILGASCILLILFAENMDKLCQGTKADIGKMNWVIISAVGMGIPYLAFKSMKELIWLGLFGMLTTVFAVIAVLIFGSQHLVSNPVPETDVVIWSGIPTALTTFSLSYAGNVVFPHVEDSMQKSKQWSLVLTCAIATITLQYVLMAIFGYVAYGPEVQNPIFGSLPNTPLNYAARIAINIHILMAAPILLCSFGNEVEQNLKISTEYMSKWKEFGFRILTRLITIILITVLSAFLPYFASFMNLIGGVSSSLSLFVFPVIFHLKIFGFRRRPFWAYPWMVIIVVIGLISFVLGTIDSIKGFIKAVEEDN